MSTFWMYLVATLDSNVRLDETADCNEATAKANHF